MTRRCGCICAKSNKLPETGQAKRPRENPNRFQSLSSVVAILARQFLINYFNLTTWALRKDNFLQPTNRLDEWADSGQLSMGPTKIDHELKRLTRKKMKPRRVAVVAVVAVFRHLSTYLLSCLLAWPLSISDVTSRSIHLKLLRTCCCCLNYIIYVLRLNRAEPSWAGQPAVQSTDQWSTHGPDRTMFILISFYFFKNLS